MARKRTKKEALKRLDSLPEFELPYHSKVPAIAHAANAAYDAAKTVAGGLVMLDPFNLLADGKIVLPLDMVAIPAYQAYMIDGSPSMQIYIRAGETIIPTGGNVRDVQEALEDVSASRLAGGVAGGSTQVHSHVGGGPRKTSAYQKRYKAAFSRLKSKHVKKDGTWKKNGFKACVKAAHAAARKK